MAKVRSIHTMSGTMDKNTYVDSKVYGPHVRARRGTYKPAVINDALKKSGNHLVKANIVAKIVHDALREYRNGLERGTCWQRLVSLFKAQYKQYGTVDFTAFNKFEIHRKYSLNRLIVIKSATPHVDPKHSELKIDVTFDPPAFRRSKHIIGYRLIGVVIYPDVAKKKALTHDVVTPVINLSEKKRDYTFSVPIPRRARDFIFCIKIEGASKLGIPSTGPTMGMTILMGASL